MPEFFDRNDNRTPRSRDAALLRDLRAILNVSKARSPALRAQLKGIEISAIKSRADLAAVPVLRKTDLAALQKDNPPFGGACATRPSALKRLLMSKGSNFEPEGQAKDWWNAARAMYAAGIRRGDIVLNSFSYHLSHGGHLVESGAHALGCPVIPAGTSEATQQIDAIRHLRPKVFCGPPEFLKVLLDTSMELGRDISSMKIGFISGTQFSANLRSEFSLRGIAVAQAYGTPDLGIVAYESEARDGLIVNEGLIVEIVNPETNQPVPPGEAGEIVVTRLNADYPLLRFGTGDISAILPGPSSCGRTNMRIKGFLGRADQMTQIKGHYVHPGQIAEITRRHPHVGRVRLVVTRLKEQDVLTLRAESQRDGGMLQQQLADTFQSITKMQSAIEIVRPGSLPNDGKIIEDDRR